MSLISTVNTPVPGSLLIWLPAVPDTPSNAVLDNDGTPVQDNDGTAVTDN